MTRETKIGLLVGLAFIIVVGILLADQLGRSIEPPPANVVSVADTVRKGITSPASQNQALPPVTPPRMVSPDTQVPTRDEVAPPPSPITVVEIHPGQGTPQVGTGNQIQVGPRPAGPTNDNTPPPAGPVVINGASRVGTQSVGGGGGTRSLVDVAAAMGETLLGPDGQPLRATLPQPKPQGDPRVVPGGSALPGNTTAVNSLNAATGSKQYKCEPGDTLSKIAQKSYGSAAKKYCDLIVKANPSLAEDPNKVIIGLTYTIPPAPGATANGAAPVAKAPAAPTDVTPPAKAPATASNAGEYVVQPGDSLTRIAVEQCGSATLVPAIKELNKDVLKGGDKILVNMKLRLPAKPLAAAASAR